MQKNSTIDEQGVRTSIELIYFVLGVNFVIFTFEYCYYGTMVYKCLVTTEHLTNLKSSKYNTVSRKSIKCPQKLNASKSVTHQLTKRQTSTLKNLEDEVLECVDSSQNYTNKIKKCVLQSKKRGIQT